MKVICLSNFYPPASRGGYEEWCQEVALGLCARGHAVVVLTSRHGAPGSPDVDPPWVYRDLHLEMTLASLRNGVEFFTHRHRRESANLDRLRQLVTQEKPDLLFIWGMWNLPRSLPALAESLLPGRVVYYMGDYWPSLPSQYQYYWAAPARTLATALPKYLLGGIARRQLARDRQPQLHFEQVLFPSQWLGQEFARMGIPVQKATVIYGAIQTAAYCTGTRKRTPSAGASLSLLYVGRLTADKGAHTALEAMGRLVGQAGMPPLTLRLVGAGDTAYCAQLRALAQQAGIAAVVDFVGPQPKAALARLYQEADILLFTSMWQEPFGRVLVEAMAAGVPVIGTPVGGAAEILHDGENGLTYAPGDAAGLATQIRRLAESPALRERLAAEGRRTAVEQFDLPRMVVEIEAYLQGVAHQS